MGPLVLGLAVVTAITGCDGPPPYAEDPDSGTDADGPYSAPEARLELESASRLSLVFGERIEFAVRYVDQNGAPIPTSAITFGLEGRAHDSSLSRLSATTDAEGRASAVLVAGSADAVFRIKIAAASAVPIYVDVSVSDMGFGSIAIKTKYEGRRMIVERVASIFADARCTDAPVVRASGDRATPLDGRGEGTFLALPAGHRYAVVARGLGADRETLALGCTDDVPVTSDTPTMRSIELLDLPLVVDGLYETQLRVASEEPAILLGAAIEAAAEAALSGGRTDADWLVDVLYRFLVARGDIEAASALESARPELETRLGDMLAAGEFGVGTGIDSVGRELARRTGTIRVDGHLTLDGPEAAEEGFVLTELSTNTLERSERRLVIDLARAGIPLRGTIESRQIKDRDELELISLRIPLPLGALGRGALAALQAEGEHSSIAAMLEATAGCNELATVTTEQSVVNSACGAECVRTACRAALVPVATAIVDALDALDVSHATWVISGRAQLEDITGDARVNRLGSDALRVVWESRTSTPSEEMSGEFEALRVELSGPP